MLVVFFTVSVSLSLEEVEKSAEVNDEVNTEEASLRDSIFWVSAWKFHDSRLCKL